MGDSDEAFQKFVQSVIGNLEKNGFPEKKVSFPLERMYEAADNKGLNFNKVLEALAGLGIAHEKTPEKVIFRSTAHDAPAAAPAGNPFEGMDLSGLRDLPPEQMMAAAAQAMQQMSPEQLEALRGVMDNMTDEQRAEMMEQAKKMGLV